MPSLTAYLSFNGNCREAMTFYHACLGGVLTFQTVHEYSSAPGDEELENCILNATLIRNQLVLVGTDLLPEDWKRGNSISLWLRCESEVSMKKSYQKLALGGKQTQPPMRTVDGALFGTLTDKFGNEWLINFSVKKLRDGRSF
ncbi:MAG: VOC family protein [Cyclobacteriaceae bacterium]|nr:VOC family protein [Cyclobacteriaceae bacterium]